MLGGCFLKELCLNTYTVAVRAVMDLSVLRAATQPQEGPATGGGQESDAVAPQGDGVGLVTYRRGGGGSSY